MSGTRLSESLPTLTNVREHCTTVQTWPNKPLQGSLNSGVAAVLNRPGIPGDSIS
jgi:hypothetical protein